MTRDLWLRECVGLVIQRLLHVQFFDSGVDNRAEQQINELSNILHETHTKLQPKEGLFNRGTQHVSNLLFKKKQEEGDEQEKKTFGEIFMEKSGLSTGLRGGVGGKRDDEGWNKKLVRICICPGFDNTSLYSHYFLLSSHYIYTTGATVGV